ncbi:thiamine diphosphokinase [Pectinatus haikarae]|uniref:thiamine diphosphokinase n=1 Tax=Pectinatus haikarae TaxID=349096 RepID=UPI0018C5D85E|nr:thiamine diphosphokinase [Pectinatus haikarae]
MSDKFLMPELVPDQKKMAGDFKKILLIAGGRTPHISWIRRAAADRIIYCADHGLDICIKAGLKPDFILGDGDSADTANWQWAKSAGVPFMSFPSDKDLTDTQLALQKITERCICADIILTGVWGGRFDHLFSSLFSLSGLSNKNVRLCAADDKETLFYLKDGHMSFRCGQRPLSISLLPFSNVCRGVSINGTKWPLDKVTLLQKMPYAVSNILQGTEECTVQVEKGILGIYFCWHDFGKI